MHILSSHTVPAGISGVRLSDYLVGVFEALPSRKSVKKAIKRGEVLIDGRPGNTGDWVQSGQHVELLAAARRPPRAYEIPLTVIYEDDFLAAVFKPGGLVVSGNQYRTLEGALAFNLKASTQSDALPWPHPVHRIDAATCGLVLVAKTRRVETALREQFEDRAVRKRYRAVVLGPLPLQGRIDTPLDEKSCLTTYTRVRLAPSPRTGWLSLADLLPHTGRTHQLRRHLAGISHPILGDKLYGKEGQILKGRGLFLCAAELSFIHPVSSQPLKLTGPVPPKFEAFLDREENRSQ